MKRTIGLAVLLLSGALTIVLAQAQSEKPGVEKLYILDCGQGVVGDISRCRLQRACARSFQDAREMRRHRAGDASGRGKGESQQHHGAVDRNMRLHRVGDSRLGACDRR